MSTFPKNPDVVVIGAGTSGLSAASALIEAGFETLVLEAAGHVGGRCITDTDIFDTPFDRGGSWLHSAEINPLSKLAETHGFALHKKPWLWEQVIIGGQHLNNHQVAEYTEYMDKMWGKIVEVGKTGNTAAIDQILPHSEWKDTAKLFIAHMLGGDYDVTSPIDIASYADAEGDWLVEGGLGAFIKHLHSDVAVITNCPVSKIDYSGPKIRITTPNGTVEANYVVVTVSVGVLAAETIEFTPSLPTRKLKAISNLPNGLLNKVGIEFDPLWQEVTDGYMFDYHTQGDEYCSILFNFYGGNLTTGFTAGRFAGQLEDEGPGAATEFCMEALREAFGSDIQKHIRRTSETAWLSNQHTLGAYSYLLPGGADAREALAETIDNKVFFAGEATMPNHFATVHGAYLSGKDVANRLDGISKN